MERNDGNADASPSRGSIAAEKRVEERPSEAAAADSDAGQSSSGHAAHCQSTSGGSATGPRDEELFLRCLAREQRRLYHYVYSLVPNAADADDVLQEATIVMWKRFADFDPDRDFLPWACGVAFFTVMNFRRAASRRRLTLSDELVELISNERLAGMERSRRRLDLLQECLSRLTSYDRDLVRRVYDEGGSATEAASEIGRAVQTVHNRLCEIRKRLLECVNRKLEAAN